MIRNLILDWSGTLVDDFTATLVATNAVFTHHGKEPFTAETFRRDFRLPYPDFYKDFLPGHELDDLEVLFKKAFFEAEKLVQPLSPTRDFLDAARQKGLRLFVLSSMNEEALLRQAKSFDLGQYFEAIYGGVLDKRGKMAEVIARHSLTPSETAYVGDMVHDVHAAEVGGVTSVAVLSGYDPVPRLCTAPLTTTPAGLRADIMVNKLRVPVLIGVPDEEREKPQDIKVSLTIETRTGLGALHDEIEGTIDYFEVTEEVKKLVAERPRKLIETLAEEIANLVVTQFGAAAVRVEIEKPILMNCEGVVVSFERRG